MTLLRARSPWISCVFLIACGGQAALPADGSTSDSDGPNGGHWVTVPVSPEPQGPADDDPSFKPVSIKVPSTNATKDAGVNDSWGSSGSSSSSSSSSGSYPPPPDDDLWGPPMINDIDSPEIATVCADRAAAKGSYTFTPSVPGVSDVAHVSITRDLTEHRWGDGIYRTTFTLFFRDAKTYVDPNYGEARRESLSWLNVHLNANASHPDAFTVGQPQTVEIGWGDGDGDPTFTCTRAGFAGLWVDAEALPYRAAVVTLTRRDGVGIAGTIDIDGGKQKLAFDAPFGEDFPGADGICCLK